MATKFKSSVEIDGYLSLTSGNWVQVPDGTTLQRPGTPAVGMFRYNTTTSEFEGYFGATPAWGAIGGGGGTVTEAFKTIAVSGQSDIVADSATDTLNVAAGSNVTLTTNAATDTLTIGSTASGGVVTIERNNYTANGSTTAFGVSSTIDSENNIQVYLDGVYQDKDTFTTAGSTVTLGTAPPNTTEVEIMHFVSVSGVVALNKYTGDGSTTTFTSSLSITNENATQIYLDGVYQSKDNYGTTGNNVTFVTAPPTGTAIEIVHMKVISASGLNANNFTGTGSQTDFTLSTTVTDENLTFVFIQGVYQDKSTYTVSGTTLTFATAPQNTYTIEVMVVTEVSMLGGDITEVIAGDGLTGGGTSGAVTLTNSAPNTDWQSTIQTSNFTAVAGKGYFVNTTSAEITVTLPVGTVGNEVIIQDYAGTFHTNKVIISANGSEKIQGRTDNSQCIIENATVSLIYQDATEGWTADNIEPPLQVSYLVVAGGGGGGYDDNGGAGAGGLRTSYGSTSGGGASSESVLDLAVATNYTVTVGAGGTGAQNNPAPANGSDSIFSTITSDGGAAAGRTTPSANDGGSGSGASGNANVTTPGQGTAGQGFNGGNGYPRTSNDEAGGGGGGAGAVGGTATANTGGAGGAGLAVSITGSSVTYAGGGGGGGRTTGGTGGSGGGAAGTGGANPSAATVNTGGGGGTAGANSGSYTGSNGGSGIVILRYANTYTLTNPGAGLTMSTATSGSDKITSFTAGTGNIQFN